MKTARELLDEMHVPHKGKTSGNFKTLCPHCSHTRKHKSDPCLSVTVDDIGAVINCHNCGHADGRRYDGNADRKQYYRKPQPKVTYSGLLAKARNNWAIRPGH